MDHASLSDLIDQICQRQSRLAAVWGSSHGWAPPEIASVLETHHLERLASLTECLKLFTRPSTQGELLLGWTLLGALVEANGRFFATLHREEFQRDLSELRREPQRPAGRSEGTWAPPEPENASLEVLCQFWERAMSRTSCESGSPNTSSVPHSDTIRGVLATISAKEKQRASFMRLVQRNRNLIHAFTRREVEGDAALFCESIRVYGEFVEHLSSRLPEEPDSSAQGWLDDAAINPDDARL